VEAYATAIRNATTPFGQAVYVHYSNLDRLRRREIEDQFAHAEVALCFASSTLELGIDIGSVDVVLMIGAPGNRATFVQRAGRASRRQHQAQVICFYRTVIEKVLFEALPHAEYPSENNNFRISVAIQQIFSLLKQSPTGALRLAPLVALFDTLLSETDLRSILGELQSRKYLVVGRDGEWKAGERLNRLIDMQSYEHQPLSIFSNIENQNSSQIKIRDQHTYNVVASVDRQWLEQDVLTLEGRSMVVEWYDGEALWISSRREAATPEKLFFRSARQMLNFEVAQQLAFQLGLSPDMMPILPYKDSWLGFHWLGDIYGRLFYELLSPKLAVEQSPQPALCILYQDDIASLSKWTEAQVTRHLRERYRSYESQLGMGAYQHLLPFDLRVRAVIEQIDVPRFVEMIARLRVVRVSDEVANALALLLQE
jgi:ATP-dependent Lhr-like helicase